MVLAKYKWFPTKTNCFSPNTNGFRQKQTFFNRKQLVLAKSNRFSLKANTSRQKQTLLAKSKWFPTKSNWSWYNASFFSIKSVYNPINHAYSLTETSRISMHRKQYSSRSIRQQAIVVTQWYVWISGYQFVSRNRSGLEETV